MPTKLFLRSWESLSWSRNSLYFIAFEGLLPCSHTSQEPHPGLHESSSNPPAQSINWIGYSIFNSQQEAGSLLHITYSMQMSPGIHCVSYPVCTRGFFPSGKAAKMQSWPLTSISIKVRNVWSYTSTLSYVFVASCLINHNNNSTSPLFLGPLCGFFPSSFLTNFVRISNLPKLATCPTHLTLFDLVLDEWYKLWNFSLCNFNHHPTICSCSGQSRTGNCHN
jgi:hypothetical protein